MTPAKRIEDRIRNARSTISAVTDERIIALGETAMAKRNEQHAAALYTRGGLRRIIMNKYWIKLATAATVIIALGFGMYVLTGSVGGTSITMAQVQQAMQNIDWVQMDCRVEDKTLTAWYSFNSKKQIGIDDKGRITFLDFEASKKLIWNPGSPDIYESNIDKDKKFAGGMNNLYERLTQSLISWEKEGNYKLTREKGIYQDRKVEIWTAHRIKGEPGPTRTEKMTVYIDVEKKLPLMGTDVKGADGDIQNTTTVEFKYPETGPADIYEAGAPKTAKITPSPEQ